MIKAELKRRLRGMGSARVSRALLGVPPTRRGGYSQHRLVLSD